MDAWCPLENGIFHRRCKLCLLSPEECPRVFPRPSTTKQGGSYGPPSPSSSERMHMHTCVPALLCLTASSTLPWSASLHPSPAQPVSLMALTVHDGTKPHRLSVFCPDLLAEPCSVPPLLPVHVHNIGCSQWQTGLGLHPVNQQPDPPLTTIFPRSSKHWHQTWAINLLL